MAICPIQKLQNEISPYSSSNVVHRLNKGDIHTFMSHVKNNVVTERDICKERVNL